MKWSIALLVLMNLGVWFGADALQAPRVSQSVASGNLPRVASLKADQSSALKEAEQASSSDLAIEPAVSSASPAPTKAPPQAAPGLDPRLVSGGVDESSSRSIGQDSGEHSGRSNGQDVPSLQSRAVGGTDVGDSPAPLMCVRLGLVKSVEEVRRLVDGQPMAGDVGMAWQEVEATLPPFHWVIIPPQPRSVALKQFRDIQRQGIDSYLVTEGENRNAISLGLFESREAAISVLEEKKRQNLNAILANFPRNQISYALVFKAEPDLAKDVVQAVKTDYGTDFDFVEINPC